MESSPIPRLGDALLLRSGAHSNTSFERITNPTRRPRSRALAGVGSPVGQTPVEGVVQEGLQEEVVQAGAQGRTGTWIRWAGGRGKQQEEPESGTDQQRPLCTHRQGRAWESSLFRSLHCRPCHRSCGLDMGPGLASLG